MSKLLIYMLALPLLFLLEQDEFSKMENIDAFKKGINNMAQNTSSIESEFHQDKYVSLLSNAVESSGTMHFKKPDLLKWSYTEPYNYGILLNGEEIKINDEGNINSFAIKNSKIFKELNDLIINSVQGDVLQEERFNISYLENKELYLARLDPKQEQFKKYVSQIDVYFDKEDFTVDKIQLFESEGDYTLIKFSHKKLNTPLEDDIFSFQ